MVTQAVSSLLCVQTFVGLAKGLASHWQVDVSYQKSHCARCDSVLKVNSTTCVGWPKTVENLPWLVCKFDVDRSFCFVLLFTYRSLFFIFSFSLRADSEHVCLNAMHDGKFKYGVESAKGFRQHKMAQHWIPWKQRLR